MLTDRSRHNRIHVRPGRPVGTHAATLARGLRGPYGPRTPANPKLNPGGYKRRYLRRWVYGRGLVYEHRYVMERKLGRLLLRSEQVHHINGDTFDNREENLELHDGQTNHFTRHQKVPHAELVALYASGLSYAQVARRAGVSPKTAFTAVTNAGASRSLQDAVALRERNRFGRFRAENVEGS